MEPNTPQVDRQNPWRFPSTSGHFAELAPHAIRQQPPAPFPQFSNYGNHRERAPQDLGWIQQEHFQYHHPPPHHHDMQLIIEREIEKEQIRGEIIRSNLARRHVLEAEVRRELMMERESVPQRGSNGFPFSSLQAMLFDSLMRLPHYVTRAEERLILVDIIAKLYEVRERLNGMQDGRLDALPFQRGSAYLKISEVKPAMNEDNKKERIILLPKPDGDASGSKRVAETSDGFMKKKARVEWSCAVCKFSASTERELNEHLHGRKHKKEEAKLRKAHKNSKNYRIGLLTKNATNYRSESLSFRETQVDTSRQSHPPSFQMDLSLQSFEENESKLGLIIRSGKIPKKKKHRARKRSKKRASQLHPAQNDGAGSRIIPAAIKETQQGQILRGSSHNS